MRYLGYEVCLLACRIAGVPDRQCNAFHRAQTCQPEGDSRSGFLPAGLPSFPVPRRAQRLLVFSFDYSACGQPIASSDLAAYCSASSARAEFLQRVRRLLTGGSLRPACALGGNRLASLFQDEVLQQPLIFSRWCWEVDSTAAHRADEREHRRPEVEKRKATTSRNSLPS